MIDIFNLVLAKAELKNNNQNKSIIKWYKNIKDKYNN